jgi:hypothetical protein
VSRGADATLVALLIIAIVAVAILAILFLPWVLAAMLVIVAIIFVAVAVLLILGGLAAIPYYFLKRGRDTEPGSYRMEQMDDMQKKERK